MEPLPKGANFMRCKMLWEIGLQIAGDPATPYFGNRDMCISVGKGSGDAFRPWLKMATGAPHLAHSVASGELDLAIVNPSGLLTQAYRGTGLFSEPLPLRVVANYPSWDRFVYVIHPRTGLRSLAEIKEKRYPLRLSTREDRTHSTRVLIEQTFAACGFSLADLESWGGSLQLNKGPGDERRLQALRDRTVDAVFDEGLAIWFDEALAADMEPVAPEPEVLDRLQAIGWRKVLMPAGQYPHLKADYVCIDFGGWPLYTRASLPDEVAYKICDAIHARETYIEWEDTNGWAPHTGMGPLGQETESTPRDVPLHPGSIRWFEEHGFPIKR
jgi:TRAP-type uncharacterized transport system substrate-binding protein